MSRTIQFTVSDKEYACIKGYANQNGLTGQYASSTLAKMLVFQAVAPSEGVKGKHGVFCSFTKEEFLDLIRYTEIKKGYAGTNAIATFIHKAAFDIMAKYPARGKE